jgi:putative oxidoreductase
MNKLFDWMFYPPVNGYKEILLIRIMTGSVFFWEGILKLVYPNQGVGRFTKLDFFFPEFMAHFVAYVEIVGGLFLLFGLLTRFTAFVFIIEMTIAILATKISVYLGNSPMPFPPSQPKIGFWAFLHEIRSDYAQLLTSIFLLLVGPGKLSLDKKWKRK